MSISKVCIYRAESWIQISTYLSTVADKVDLGTAPITLSFFSPFLKKRTVGMLLIPYCVGMFGESSVLSLKHAIFPAYSLANSSITGAIILHGPHHGAQNSTNTGVSLAITRLFQVESVTTRTAQFHHMFILSPHSNKINTHSSFKQQVFIIILSRCVIFIG